MYAIVKNVIEASNYELTGMLKKIDTLWVQGGLTDDQREKLITLAQEKANVIHSINVLAKLEELDKRVRALEELTAIKGEQEEPDNSDAPETPEQEGVNGDTAETYPDYVPGTWYYAGDKVTFNNVVYTCIAPEGQVCTWSPSEYPVYWEQCN